MAAAVAEQQSSSLFALVSPPENAALALPNLPETLDREDFRTPNFSPESFLAERRVRVKHHLSALLSRGAVDPIELVLFFCVFCSTGTQVFALEKLKNDLKNHLGVMKNELVELINQDCWCFMVMLGDNNVFLTRFYGAFGGMQTATLSTLVQISLAWTR